MCSLLFFFFFSSRRRHTRCSRDWSSDVCSSDLSRPASLASRFFASEVYGRNPYGRSATRESYTAVTRDDVTAFAGQRLRPAGALLVVAGDVTAPGPAGVRGMAGDRKSTRLNSSHGYISYAVFCLKKKKKR